MTEKKTTKTLPSSRGGGRSAKRQKKGGAGASKAASSRQWQRSPRPRQRGSRDGAQGGREMVTIELSKAQVDQVVRAAGQGGTMSVLLSALKDPGWTLSLDSDDWTYPAQMEDRRLSRSLLSGLLVLSCFPSDGGYLGIAELARMLGMNTSTTHRYVTTLLAVGLLERDAATRRYRLTEP
jgi:predicted transcriptional regulator